MLSVTSPATCTRSRGSPRACDLYPIHGQIADTLRRAVALLNDGTWPVALAILQQVTEGVGVSLRGQDAGPITPDFLLTLAMDATTTPARRPATQALIDNALTEGGGRRYYSTLAEYRLMAARFAIASGDTSQAETYWNEACVLMTAYGFHKDTRSTRSSIRSRTSSLQIQPAPGFGWRRCNRPASGWCSTPTGKEPVVP